MKDLSAYHDSVVFSGWTSTLDLIAHYLKNVVEFVRIDGRLSQKERNASLAAFHNRPEVYVILISLTCGAVGYVFAFARGVTFADRLLLDLISHQRAVST